MISLLLLPLMIFYFHYHDTSTSNTSAFVPGLTSVADAGDDSFTACAAVNNFTSISDVEDFTSISGVVVFLLLVMFLISLMLLLYSMVASISALEYKVSFGTVVVAYLSVPFWYSMLLCNVCCFPFHCFNIFFQYFKSGYTNDNIHHFSQCK